MKIVHQKKWIALVIDCYTGQNEQVLAILYSKMPKDSGVEIRDSKIEGQNLIVAYFFEKDAKLMEDVKKSIKNDKNMFDGTDNIKFETYIVNEEDWANSWKQFFTPRKLGKKIIVTPSWDKFKPKNGELPILIEPGMAFGTGHHETTHLCVKLIEEYVKKDDIVFDVGTGTGILAIAARLLGADLVVGTDIDKYAVKVAKENIKINKCSDRVKAFYGNLLSFRNKIKDELILRKCDVIVCNILKDAVLRIADKLNEMLRPGGIVIISGILGTQYEEVEKAFCACGFKPKRLVGENEWVACSFQSQMPEIMKLKKNKK